MISKSKFCHTYNKKYFKNQLPTRHTCKHDQLSTGFAMLGNEEKPIKIS